MPRIAEQVTASGDLSARVPEPGGGGELARLGHTFNSMLTRLQAFRQRETEFTRHASHELRTPLTALRAHPDANKQGWVTDAEVLRTADVQVERLTRLTSALLLLSRENRVLKTTFDLGARVRSVTEYHDAAYRGPDSLRWTGNETLITQALENLLRNAQRHAPSAKVTVTLNVQDGQLQLAVEDNGAGVPAEALCHLGEPFYRAPGTVVSGSGLGLAVVRRIAEVHGGQLLISAAPPHGLRVALNFPHGQGSKDGDTRQPATSYHDGGRLRCPG